MRQWKRWGVLLGILLAAVQVVSVSAQQGPIEGPDGRMVFPDLKGQAEWDAANPRPAFRADETDGTDALNVDGTFWSNGPFNTTNGLASEINTFGAGVQARTADNFDVGASSGTFQFPFNVPLAALVTTARASLLHNATPTTAELEIWADAGGNLGPQNTPTATILDGLFNPAAPANLGTAFGIPLLEYSWPVNLAFGPGRYWLTPIGYGLSGNPFSRSFFATSNGGRNGTGGLQGFFRSTTFGVPNWGFAGNQLGGTPQFAFDLDGTASFGLAGVLLDVPTGQTLDGPWCQTGQARVQFVLSNTGTAAIPDTAANEFVATFTNLNVISCTASSGTCTVSGGTITANHSIPAGGSVTLTVALSESGGVQTSVTSAITIVTNYAQPPATVPTTITINASLTLGCSRTVDPNRQLGCQVHLPILNFEGQDDVCETWIEVQMIACEAHKAVLVTWGEPGFCPPQAAGPLKVECTGLLRPGSTWNLLGAQIPTGSKGGMLFKFSARQLLELGIDLGFDDVVADLMCETLFFGIVGDADDYRRFKKAYNEGLDFAGIPMDIAMGDGYLAVDVLRKCPGDVTPGVRVTSKYNGIAGSHLGYYDPVFGGFGYYAPLLYADKGGFNSIMYIQNGGLECSSIEIWFKGQDDCLRAKICEIFTLAPGETYQWDASDCVGPDWQGSAWLRSTQPLGIAVDIIGRDVLMTYIGEPAEINYTYDPRKSFITEGDQVAYGPLTYSEYQGWDTGVQVQNLSGVVNAKVKVYFYDRSGDIITTLVDWICPRGSQTFFLPVVHDLPGNWIGWVRVESQEWISPGSPAVSPPNVVGVVTLIKYNDAARTETEEAIAYNLLPEHKAYDWQLGYAGGGTASGIALIAIPSLLKDLDGTGTTSELAIANMVPKPGKTDFAIFIYDQNGLLDYICQVLNDRQVEYIDLQTWGYVNPGFKGSAIISATFWEHDVFDGGGRFVRNLVGLGAVAVERTGTRLGEDIPGDESAGDRGIPFSIDDLRSLVCLDRFTSGIVPLCPGQPGTKIGQNCIVGRLVAQSTTTPRALPDAVVTNDIITVNLPAGCLIADVDVWLSMFHTQQMVDWLVDLDGPGALPTVRLFGQICGPGVQSGFIRTIIDDEASPPIGNVALGAKCPPDDFRRYGLQTPTATNRLSIYDGNSPNGNWTLLVTDQNVFIPGSPAGTPNLQNDAGTLFFWELEFDFQ